MSAHSDASRQRRAICSIYRRGGTGPQTRSVVSPRAAAGRDSRAPPLRGRMITGLLEDLLNALPDDAFPGENHAEVLLEMLSGTVRPATRAAGQATVCQLTALLGAVSDRILTDLRAAAAAAR